MKCMIRKKRRKRVEKFRTERRHRGKYYIAYDKQDMNLKGEKQER